MNDTDQSFEGAFPQLTQLAQRKAQRLLGNTAESEEIAQEALLRAHGQWETVAPYAPAWVSRVATNLAISRLRQRREEPLVRDLADRMESTDTRIDLLRVIDSLPDRQRQVVLLRHGIGYSEREVAEILDISVGSVKRHTHRAMERLRSTDRGLTGYAPTTPGVTMTDLSWRSRFEPAAAPPSGWPPQPWDHRYVEGDDGTVQRVAIDDHGEVILDADGDEVMSGPGFDFHAVKVVRSLAQEVVEDDAPPIDMDHLDPAAAKAIERAARWSEVLGHSWIGTEHLGLALLEISADAREVIGMDHLRLLARTAEVYEGPLAQARVDKALARLDGDWQLPPVDGGVASAHNWKLRSTVSDLGASTTAPITPGDLARALIADPYSMVSRAIAPGSGS